MHGLINLSIESFLRHTYGVPLWSAVAEASGLDVRGFQTVRRYPDSISFALINNAAAQLDKPEAELLDDLGAWLARLEPVRRLLRFSGRNFTDFLYALEELQGRAHMVVSDLGMPRIQVECVDSNVWRVVMPDCFPEWRSVMAGMVRCMADDYGTLSLIAVEGNAVRVQISHGTFSEGRDFDLGISLESDEGAKS